MSKETFFRMLRRIMPQNAVPFAALGWQAQIHPLIFVHRVEGLASGAYILIRDGEEDMVQKMQDAFSERFVWRKVEESGLPLYLLVEEDVTTTASMVSCNQNIASDGCFAVGMLAEMGNVLDRHGAGAYRRLHWEAGALGHVLYLEAEANKLRGTGIGCFFDDAVHHFLGMQDASPRFQTMYHFTLGAGVEDTRIQNLPAYHHLGSGGKMTRHRTGEVLPEGLV